jgi:broad specificity phosphatase PhoE
MKKIYLVRHGETTSNLKQTWRTASESLTDTGMAQARQAGLRVRSLPVDKMYASTAERTLKTADIICENSTLEYEGSALFYEEKTPTSIQGLVHEKKPDNPIEQYVQALLEHSEDPDYHYEDEENLFERKARIEKILTFLTEAPEDNILVVTHGNILKMLAAYIILGPDCTAKELYLCSQRLKTSNTGITLLEYTSKEWRMLIWNDHEHFAE